MFHSNYRAFSDGHSIQDSHVTLNPTVIFNRNTFLINTLALNINFYIIEIMVSSKKAAPRTKH